MAWCGSRARLRGVATGTARSARACSSVRGSTHPTSDTISSRYTDANHGVANTSNSPILSSIGASAGLSVKYWSTSRWFSDRCGSSAPGIAATASRNSSTRAVRIDVRPRQVLRSTATGDVRTGAGGVGRSGASTMIGVH